MKVLVRHDAPLRLTTTSGLFGKITRKSEIVRADLLDAHLTVMACMHGKVSGYEGSSAACEINGIELADPSYATSEQDLCTCKSCGGEDRPWPEGLE